MKIIILDEETGIIAVGSECEADALLRALKEGQISKAELIMLFVNINSSSGHSDAEKLAKLVPLIKMDTTRFSRERDFKRPQKKIMTMELWVP